MASLIDHAPGSDSGARGARRRHRPRLRRPAARGRVRPRRVSVTGFDVDAHKAAQINAGKSYIPDVPDSDLSEAVHAGKLRATTDMHALGEMDAIDICVPTPLRKTKDPDLSYVVHAVEAVAATPQARPTRDPSDRRRIRGPPTEVVQPMLTAKGFTPDVDFFLAFSPERVEPGNPRFNTKNIPKIVGGAGRASTRSGPRRSTVRPRARHPGHFDACLGYGQTSREHLPRGEHRPSSTKSR
jgi:hypothetical protein